MTSLLVLTHDHALQGQRELELNLAGFSPVIHHRGGDALHALSEGSFSLFWIKEAPPDMDLSVLLKEARRMCPWTLLCLSDLPEHLPNDLSAQADLHRVPSSLKAVPDVFRHLLSGHTAPGAEKGASASMLRLVRHLPDLLRDRTDEIQLWGDLLKAFSQGVDASASAVLLKQGHDWEIHYPAQPSLPPQRQTKLCSSACACVSMLLGHRPHLSGDTCGQDLCSDPAAPQPPDQETLTLPVWSEAGLKGVLVLTPESSSPVSETDLALLYQMVHLVQRIQHQQRELREMANRDPLTGCYNRRCLEEIYHDLRLRSQQAQKSLAVLFIDLDDFKEINDQLGHEVGDQVLEAFACSLRRLVEDTAAVFRLGGDEFLVLKGSTDPEEARRLGTRISATFSETVLLNEPQTIRVPVSVGIAIHGPDQLETSLETFIQEADRDLYRTKVLPAPEQHGL